MSPTLNVAKVKDLRMKRLAIFASGNGSNAERLISRFSNEKNATISLLLADQPHAYALQRAENHGVASIYIPRTPNFENATLDALKQFDIDFIVLAGFLWKVPDAVIARFPRRIINLHPALLPKYGGKGYYGAAVHKAVIDAHEKLSGITIHYVNQRYDEGEIIFQATCPVLPNDTPETLAARIHTLEHQHLPEVTLQLVNNLD